jgi:hypothetical protein
MLLRFVFLIISPIFFACTSSEYKQSGDYDYDANSTAEGSAYAAEGFTFKKKEPMPADTRRMRFYYKKCELSGDESYYSLTSYDCSEP